MKNRKLSAVANPIIDSSKLYRFGIDKVATFQAMISKTVLAVQRYKVMDIITAGELGIALQGLEGLYNESTKISHLLDSEEHPNEESGVVRRLQSINNVLSGIFRTFGTESITDLVGVAMGQDFLETIITNDGQHVYEVISSYVHPIGYKVMPWSKKTKAAANKSHLPRNKIVEDFAIADKAQTFDAFNLARTTKSFRTKVYGIKIAIQNPAQKNCLVISAVVDDLPLVCSNISYIKTKLQTLTGTFRQPAESDRKDFNRFVSSLTIKDLLIYSEVELCDRFTGLLKQAVLVKHKPISQSVKEFLAMGLYGQRSTLIGLLIRADKPEFQYLAYLLYDLLSNDSNGHIDTLEQTILFDSLPWSVKKYFRAAMKVTIKYTKNLVNFDSNTIPIEQQICLLRVPETVKERAMQKLKEVKAKSEESGSKARQYLEGLLRIPFGRYKEEEFLSEMNRIRDAFSELIQLTDSSSKKLMPRKELYTSPEIASYIRDLRKGGLEKLRKNVIMEMQNRVTVGKRTDLVANICFMNEIIRRHALSSKRLCHSGKRNDYMRDHLKKFIADHADSLRVTTDLKAHFCTAWDMGTIDKVQSYLKRIEKGREFIGTSMTDVSERLSRAIHGHKTAKRQLERIVGQWVNGKQTGYCFGFEGPPGVGKTSLAKKGLADCLRDTSGQPRPFAFIPLGGTSNGSTLVGHNYTYVGSTWGRIVDILIEKKCMNPIIFIDELDKVSRSENGKEVIGVLTHLVDSAQNDSFQDRYFSGIDLDLSKALFIFSYNDPESIDKILLDRIHRVRFEPLSLDDKITIAKEYLLPEIYDKMGLGKSISFPDQTVRSIIQQYTFEAGVRKLKELLFEIVSEINLMIIQDRTGKIQLPLVVTEMGVKTNYLKDKIPVIMRKVPSEPCCGLVNGLWANALGKGGVLPIECCFSPATKAFELCLTGLQGEVMQESMDVAKTVAWRLTSPAQKKKIKSIHKTDGIHVHCPEGAVSKDGPSAGAAVTVAMYSLFNNKKVNCRVALTGEISLTGRVSAIGGLGNKVVGGIRAGVSRFIYPEDNKRDIIKFKKRYEDKLDLTGISFHSVSCIEDILEAVFVE